MKLIKKQLPKLLAILGGILFAATPALAVSILHVQQGGTGWGYPGGFQAHTVLIGNGTGNIGTTSPTANTGYVLTSNGLNADPTFQASTGGNSFAYPFPSNATSTLINFSGGIQVGTLSGLISGNSGTLYGTATSTISFGYASTTQLTTTGSTYLATLGGNVGIGTTGPTYKLDVSGLGHFTGLVDAPNFVATSTTATSTFAGGLTVGTSKLVVDSTTGNVGVGATPSALSYEKLLVSGDDARFRLVNPGGSGEGLYMYTGSTLGASLAADSSGNATFGALTSFAIQTAATERMRITSTGNVGIGTTSPVSKLSVVGESALAGGLSVGLGYAGTAAPSNGLIIQGNVGIGTNSPGNKLDVNGNISLADAGLLGFMGSSVVTTSNYSLYGDTGLTLINARTGAVIGFRVNNVDVARISTTGGYAFGSTYYSTDPGANNMIIQGNVGIGTTSPYANLSIQNNYGSTNNTLFSIASSTSSDGSTSSNLVNVDRAGVLTVQNLSSPYIGSINTNLDLHATGGGRILVTAGSGVNFSSDTVIGLSNGTTVIDGAISRVSPGVLGIGTGAVGSFAADLKLTNLTAMGNVGIGTSTPLRTLTIANDERYSQIGLVDLAGTFGNKIGTIGYINGVFKFNTLADNYASTTRMTIDDNGRVGIATSSPYAALSVNGKIAGTVLSIDGTIATSVISSPLSVSGNFMLPSLSSGLLKGNGASAVSIASNGTDFTLITANTCGAGNHFSAITAAGVLTCSADSGGGSGTVATSSQETAGQLAVWGTTNGYPAKLYSLATSTATLGLGLGGSLTGFGTNSLTIATSSLFSGTTGQFPYFSGTNALIGTSTISIATNGTITINNGLAGDALTTYGSTSHEWSVGAAISDFSFHISSSTTLGTNDYFKALAGSTWLPQLTGNGFVKTSGGTGLLSIDTSTYLTANQSITLSGAVTGTGSTAITTAFGSQTAGVLGNAVTGNTAPMATSTLYGNIGTANYGSMLSWNGSSLAFMATSTTFSGTTGQFPYFSATNTLTATSSLFLAASGNIGVASSTPAYRFSVGTYGNQFAVNSSGMIMAAASQPATSTAITLDWSATPNQVEYQIGFSATTITIINATTSGMWGSRKLVPVCNPNGTAGALTWVGVEWIGTAPTQTTTTGACDIYSFAITYATSTTAFKVMGSAGTGFK